MANFSDLVELAMRDPQLHGVRPVVEKELLHYDILFALDKEQLLEGIVFQGGTSLRLCHGSRRFSEDLDFAGGVDFSFPKLARMKECIEDHLVRRYGLEVSVKEPKQTSPSLVNVATWQIKIRTAPERPHLPKQMIKLEVANIPAHTREPKHLSRNYDFLPQGYEDFFIMTESREEIMADKLLALPVVATQGRYRYRDIWDLGFLATQKIKPDSELVQRKIEDYGVTNYDAALDNIISRLPEVIHGTDFVSEMQRFLPPSIVDETLNRAVFGQWLQSTLSDMFVNVRDELRYGPSDAPTFRM